MKHTPERRAELSAIYRSTMNFSPAANLGEPMDIKPTTKQQTRALSAKGLSLEGGELLASRITIGSGGGNSKRAKRAAGFFAERMQVRKQAGHCTRCARVSDSGKRQCLACLDYQEKYRKRMRGKEWRTAEKFTPSQMIAAVVQLRRELDALQKTIKAMQAEHRRRYKREWTARRVLNKYADAYPTISKQELSEINHAYDSPSH
jgi:hypothetical protein